METKKSKKKTFIIIVLILAAMTVFVLFGPFTVIKMYDLDTQNSFWKIVKTNATEIQDGDSSGIVYYTPTLKRMKKLKKLIIINCSDYSFLSDMNDLQRMKMYFTEDCTIEYFPQKDSLEYLEIDSGIMWGDGHSDDFYISGVNELEGKFPNVKTLFFNVYKHQVNINEADKTFESCEHLDRKSPPIKKRNYILD